MKNGLYSALCSLDSCAVVSKMTNVLVTYHILMLLAGGILLLGDSADLRVQVVSVFVMDLKKPCHVVDTCDQLGTSLKLVFIPIPSRSFWEQT